MSEGRQNAILAVFLAILVVSGTYAAYTNLAPTSQPTCVEGQEIIADQCEDIADGGGGNGGEGNNNSGSHNLSEDDCTSSQIWRDQECQTMLAPNTLSYGENEFHFILGQTSQSMVSPSFSGDAPDSWAVSPSLPNGMNLNPASGEITGTPLEESPASEYTIVAANIAGLTSVPIIISAIPPIPSFTLDNPLLQLTLGEFFLSSPPIIQNGSVDSWLTSPPLPIGLSLNYDGAITGRPQALGTTIHTLIGNNSGGSSFQNFSITVIDVTPNNLQYLGTPFVFTIDEEIDTIPPSISGGAATSWAIEPELPSGLEFNNSNGWISGTPSSLYPQAIHVVWANNSGGNHSSAIQLSVVDEVVREINYSGNSIDVAWNVEMINRTPIFTGGSPLSWGLSAILPSGLSFNTSTGQISGVASELIPWTNYTVWANNSGGSGIAFISIRVADLTPSNISWNGSQFAFASNESLFLEVTNEGPVIDSWEVSPSLPSGLTLDAHGNISGVPTERSDWQIYTIWANNTGGSLTMNLSMAIHDLDADWNDITAGVGSVDYGSSWPSLIVPIGEWAFPIGIDWNDRPIITANHVGRGKIVGYGHEGMVAKTSGSEATLSINVAKWVCGDGINVALESGYNGWENELQAEGFTVTTSVNPDNLAGQDCYIGDFWNGWSDFQNRAIEQFLLNGGGVVLGGHSWYWSYSNSDVAHNYPGNKISKISGLFVSSSSGSVSLNFQNGPPSPYFRTRDALSGVEAHLSSGPLLNQSNSGIAAGTISRAASNLPLDFDLFWNPVRSMTNDTGWIQISASNTFSLGSDPIDDLILNVQEQLMLQLPADELVAHPSAIDFPGEVPVNSPRVSRSMTLQGNFSGLPSQFGYAGARSHGRMGTGLYAAAGEVVNVSLPQSIVGQNAYILVGAHSDSLWGKSSLSRHPKVVRWWPIENVSMQVGNAFGGVIYLAIPAGGAFGLLNLSFENAVEMPRYIHGQTSISDWQNTTRLFPAPYAELESDYFILTVPSKDIRSLDDPDYAMDFWGEALQMEHNLSGYVPWPRVERAVFDVQISAGWMHSGYPFMAHHASVAGVVNGTQMYQDGDWGMFHELGHNHQWGSATLPGTTETTCNLYSVKLMTDLVGKDLRAGHSALNTNSANSRIETYFNNGAQINSWSVWTALETYLQIQEEFGWEPITAAFQEYYYNYSTQPSGDSNEFNQYAIQISLNTGYNLVPFLEAWGFPITQITKDSVDHLPVWTTDPLRGWVHDYDSQIRSLSESNVSGGNANLDFEIYDNGTDVNLTICWGLADGGTNTSTWSNCQSAGVAYVGWQSQNISNLLTGQTYFWRVMGENQNSQTWTAAAIFQS
jgi:hypothetical protein